MILERIKNITYFDYRTAILQAKNIDDIADVFKKVFAKQLGIVESFYFKNTYSSQVLPLSKLISKQAIDQKSVNTALTYMNEAKNGLLEKRKPVYVLDMGNGKFKVLDGNADYHALKELGEENVVVEVKKSLKQQDVSKIDDLYKKAETALPLFVQWIAHYAQKTSAKVILRQGLKNKDIAIEKVNNDYKGAASKLLDVVAGTLVYEQMEQITSAFSLIINDPAVFRVKNRFEKPSADGYMDIMINVQLGGHVCELQMNISSIFDVKEKFGQKIYDINKQLESIARQEDLGDIAFLAEGFISKFRKLSSKVYRHAAASAISTSNSSDSNKASDSEIAKEFDLILKALSESLIISHFDIALPIIRNTLPPSRSMAYGTSSISPNEKLYDNISKLPPFDGKEITKNNNKINVKVIAGKRTRAYLSDDTKVSLQFAVIEIDELVISHDENLNLNSEFPKELQPRDRQRNAMMLQIDKISNNLNPDRMGESVQASVGAPIVGVDLVVESGNGRTIALKKYYNRFVDKRDQNQYISWIEDNACNLGIKKDDIENFKKPALVRIRLTDIDRTSFTEKANKIEIASMSPMEVAKMDSRMLDKADIELFNPSENGDINSTSNQNFIARFSNKLGISEIAGLTTASGQMTRQMIDRITAAVFQKAYNDDRLLELMAEEATPEAKNIVNALVVASGEVAKALNFENDATTANFVKNLMEAVKYVRRSKAEKMSLDMVLNQLGLWEKVNEDVKILANFINDNIRSAKKMGLVLKQI
ncbi:MAG: hypothetical protein HQK78_20080, partial [Desulfobacterales bacterium]|nr:hypothetical protein [Desulfobacterales bacterium]